MRPGMILNSEKLIAGTKLDCRLDWPNCSIKLALLQQHLAELSVSKESLGSRAIVVSNSNWASGKRFCRRRN